MSIDVRETFHDTVAFGTINGWDFQTFRSIYFYSTIEQMQARILSVMVTLAL